MLKMRSVRGQKVLLFIFAFSAGVFLTLLSVRRHENPSSVGNSDTSEFSWKQSEYLLLVVIPSAPGNLKQRNAIRQTWINGKYQLADRNYPKNPFRPRFNYEGFLSHETIEEQIQQLKSFSDWHDNLRSDTFGQLPVKITHRFVIGSLLDDDVVAKALQEEEEEYKDLLLLPNLLDSYVNLTRKVLMSFSEVERTLNFDFLLKTDDDSFVNLPVLAEDLWQYHQQLNKGRVEGQLTPQLYWGFFNGRAQIKSGGQWKETNYNLCDRFLPYALGGGYVLSRGLVQFIARNAHRLTVFRSEDVSIGTWLSPLVHVHRRHDVRFDTGYVPRKCQKYHLVLHKRTKEDMYKLWNGVACSQLQSSMQYNTKPKEYYYDWSQPPSKCCDVVLN